MSAGGVLMETVRLTGGYEGRKVLDNVSMKVHMGEILVIVGRSGCGKSTLMNHLLGLVKPWSGEVLFEGPTSGATARPSPGRGGDGASCSSPAPSWEA